MTHVTGFLPNDGIPTERLDRSVRGRGDPDIWSLIDDAAGKSLPTAPKLAPSGRAGVRALKRPWSVRAAGGADTMRLRPNLCTGGADPTPGHGQTIPAPAIISPCPPPGQAEGNRFGAPP